MVTLSKENDEKIIELTKEIANLKDVEAYNKSLVDNVQFLERSMSDENKLVKNLEASKTKLEANLKNLKISLIQANDAINESKKKEIYQTLELDESNKTILKLVTGTSRLDNLLSIGK